MYGAGKCLAKGHIANKFQSWNLNLALLIPIICFFYSISLASYTSVKAFLHFTGHNCNPEFYFFRSTLLYLPLH